MEFVIELVALALVGWAVGAAARAVISRRAGRRAEVVAGGTIAAVPCRLAWKAGNGARGFVYGKLTRDDSGVCFKRISRRPIRVPEGGRISRNRHWRPGMQLLQYRTPEGEELRFLCYDADCDTVSQYLRVPNPADFD